MKERRVHLRLKVFKAGKIFLGRTVVPCVVRNISQSGACLQLQATYGIPSTFDFAMADGSPRHCKVAWLNDSRMGVAFVEAA